MDDIINLAVVMAISSFSFKHDNYIFLEFEGNSGFHNFSRQRQVKLPAVLNLIFLWQFDTIVKPL